MPPSIHSTNQQTTDPSADYKAEFSRNLKIDGIPLQTAIKSARSSRSMLNIAANLEKQIQQNKPGMLTHATTVATLGSAVGLVSSGILDAQYGDTSGATVKIGTGVGVTLAHAHYTSDRKWAEKNKLEVLNEKLQEVESLADQQKTKEDRLERRKQRNAESKANAHARNKAAIESQARKSVEAQPLIATPSSTPDEDEPDEDEITPAPTKQQRKPKRRHTTQAVAEAASSSTPSSQTQNTAKLEESEAFKNSTALKKMAKKVTDNQQCKKELDKLTEDIELGRSHNAKHIKKIKGARVFEARGLANGIRIFYMQTQNGPEILGISTKKGQKEAINQIDVALTKRA